MKFYDLTMLNVILTLGKTTVGALLERFYDPKEGSILLDGCDIEDLDTKWLRGSYLGYIGQVQEYM
jgi:ABC-type multidrug transport system fused ATPase/permease subunit